jgi:hypothetical protein
MTCTDVGQDSSGPGGREAGEMSVAAEADLPLDELLARQQALAAELRDVEHWHRLAAARLDLAVAAVTDIDELTGPPVPCTRLAPYALRTRVGIPDTRHALPETAALLRLRSVLEELDTYATALRLSCDQVWRQILLRLDEHGDPSPDALRDGEAWARPVIGDGADQAIARRVVTRRTRGVERTGHDDRQTSRPVILGPVGSSDDGDR